MPDPNEITDGSGYQNKQTLATCTKCGLMIVGQFVRALGGTFHLECFKCQDCGEVVAAKFFPFDDAGGNQHPLCERDYFRRQGLICAKCGDALRASYITALKKKYHIEHFTCSVCPTVFGPDDSYYEHDGEVYCHFHYSTRFAVKCTGCQTAILKQFVEINRNSIDEHWHPECYMIHKFWNVKLAAQSDEFSNKKLESEFNTAEELKKQQKAMEEKVYSIWTILSAFEESSAACISDMLLHVSNGTYIDGVKMAEQFIMHVEFLFSAIDELESQLSRASGHGLQHNREAKQLCKKIVNFFSLLSHTQEAGVRRLGITQELLSLVTGLAHYLKILIRIALTGALKLERDYNNSSVISRFLNKLVELANKDRQQTESAMNSEVTSDLCHLCHITVEEECFKYKHYRWHNGCFRCSGPCGRELRSIYHEARFNQTTEKVYCPKCATDPSSTGLEYVTQLEQYTYLLRVALSRLYGLLQKKDGHGHDNRGLGMGKEEKHYDVLNITTDMKRVKSVHIPGKLPMPGRIAMRSRIIEHESPNSTGNGRTGNSLLREPSQRQVKIVEDKLPEQKMELDFQDEAITLGDISTIAEMAAAEEQNPEKETPEKQRRLSKPKNYLSELSALKYFIVKHVAVVIIGQHLKEYFTLEELLDLAGSKKATLWNRFVTRVQGDKKKKGTFGVPLEVLIERYGVDSVLGAGPGRIRIPSFVDDSISAMKTMDMSVEGIFRKNGNIRRLKELVEAIDQDPSSVDLSANNPVQVAALMKKFLRDLPDPLLTFKLHKLFVTSQRIEDETIRKKVLHLTCCLMPKANRDAMEVLFIFFKWVASFSHVDEETGSKMDLHNLATVISPNILYSKSKDPAKDDSFLAIEAIHSLLRYQDEFWTVPEELVAALNDQDLLSNPENLTSRDIIKRYENISKNIPDDYQIVEKSGEMKPTEGRYTMHQQDNNPSLQPHSSANLVPVEQQAS